MLRPCYTWARSTMMASSRTGGSVARLILAIILTLVPPHMAKAGAPREGGRFRNLAGTRPMPGSGAMFPFFLRKAWTSIVGRGGAPQLVPFDRAAIQQNPSITWIGHSTMLVRMDGVTFLTDPIFSDWAGPFPHLGPKRHVPPGVPLEELPPVDFAVLSHDHYDHTDLPS